MADDTVFDPELLASMRAVYNRCSSGTEMNVPEVALVAGELLNYVLESPEYDTASCYLVTPEGITKVE